MQEYFWTLVLEEGWVQAGIWTTKSGEVEILKVSNPAYWETAQDLISASDSCLSSLVSDLPEDLAEPSKTVFGVPASWVTSGEIKHEHLEKIRVLCSKLSLEPSGFVVLPEAIAYWVKSVEGSPLSGVVVGLGANELEVSIFKLGNLVGSVSVARSVSLEEDIVEGLVRFKLNGEIPSRFLIYDGKGGELAEAKDKLLAVDWMGRGDRIKLLHLPKIEVVEAADKTTAVSLSGASEITGAKILFKKPQPKIYDHETKNLETVGVPDASPQSVGFNVGHDVVNTQRSQTPRYPPPLIQTVKLPVLASVRTAFTGIIAKLPKINFGSAKFVMKGEGGGKNLKILLAAVVFLVIGSFAAWWFLPKAVVGIYVSPKKIEKSESVFISPDSEYDFSEKRLPGKVLSEKVTGDKTASTTGKKLVGEKARGKVQIRNGTSSSVKLASGAVITGANDLKFTLDSSASISAAISPANPGTGVVEVSAYDIGSQYNLAKGETFVVTNYPKSEVDGISEANFAGGSSREISSVSEEDQEKLESELMDELTRQAEGKIAEKKSSIEVLVEGASVSEVEDKSFSGKIGDEADTLKLSLDLAVNTLVLEKGTLDNFTKDLLANDIPSGFVLRDDQVKIEFEFVGEENGIWEVTLRYAVNLLPEINHKEIVEKVKGKYPDIASKYLSSIPGFARAEIKLNPKLPGFLGTLPRIAKNISVEVSSER